MLNSFIKNRLLYFVPVLIFLLGTINSVCTYSLIFIAFAFGSYLGYRSIKCPGTYYCKLIIILLSFRNGIIGIGCHYFNNLDR